jgi:hypothetical protein
LYTKFLVCWHGHGFGIDGEELACKRSSFLYIMVIMATKPPPKLSIQDEAEWLEQDSAARLINNSPFPQTQ